MNDAGTDGEHARMNGFDRMQHRLSMIAGGVLAVAIGALLLVLGTADDAAGRGAPAIGDGTGGVDFGNVGDGTFESPVNVAFAPGQPANVYVVEQDGTVEVLVNNVEQADPFLDIRDLTDGTGERGLLGLAFHPNFAGNGLVYAYYTDQSNGDIVVSEFGTAGPLDADEASRRQVIRIRHRAQPNHNGGQLLFGPDGFLYMGTGDGGDGGDPRENGQDKRSLLGKLLRINPIDPPGPRAYRNPKGNPYVGRKGKNAIFARGLRNPFRFSFDQMTDRIAIGDVGQNQFEEVDYETPKRLRGANFGWDRWEGFRRFRDSTDNEAKRPKPKHHDKPIHAYSHSQGRCSITGGVVVRDGSLTNLYGRYLYADFCQGRLRSFIPGLGRATDDKPLDDTFANPTSFTTSPFDQRVYVTGLGGQVRVLD
jgi:Glucose / Sorbosone dehydrogenase